MKNCVENITIAKKTIQFKLVDCNGNSSWWSYIPQVGLISEWGIFDIELKSMKEDCIKKRLEKFFN